MEGKFDNLPISKHEQEMLQDAYDTVTKLELWEWLKHPDVPGNGGFMFSTSPEVSQISNAMTYTGHSGASFGFTMRAMEFIAKRGWDAYVSTVYPVKYRITWTMANGYRGQGEPVFDSHAAAAEFIKRQMKEDRESGWNINYEIERV